MSKGKMLQHWSKDLFQSRPGDTRDAQSKKGPGV